MDCKYCTTQVSGHGYCRLGRIWRWRSGIGGQMDDEGYKPWRRRWLRLHSRSLLANSLALAAEVELEAYLREMRTAYRNYGDFTENEIDFIFRRVRRGIQRMPTPHSAPQCARRARGRIRALGQRLMTEAAWLNARVP